MSSFHSMKILAGAMGIVFWFLTISDSQQCDWATWLVDVFATFASSKLITKCLYYLSSFQETHFLNNTYFLYYL